MNLLRLLLFFMFCLPLAAKPQGNFTVENNSFGQSFSTKMLVYEDKEKTVEIEDVLLFPNDSFAVMKEESPRVQFTKSRFWLKFSITNQSDFWDLFIETARPITDQIFFYQVNEKGEVLRTLINGDDFNYYDKDVPHRKNLFPIQINRNETQHFYIAVISGGEGILLPLKVHEKMAFFEQDYKDQFKNGFYYGVIGLVIVIYFFFFLLLKDRSFLYYILYVFFQGLLQFSLDGYSHHHFFPNNDYMVNRFPPFVGAMAIVFMLIYVSNYLGLSQKKPQLNKAFKIAGVLIAIALVFTFLPGRFHAVSYPMVNGFSLISIVLSVGTIFYLRLKGQEIDNYFTLAFVVLIAGAILFILGNFGIIQNASISLNALKVCSVLEIVILSISMSYKYRELQKDKELAQAVALKNLEEKNAAMDEINVRLEEQVIARTSEIESQRAELAYKNKEILSSIKYAKRIQEAILPSDEQVSRLLKNSFVLYKPKDVVSGDFYFVESQENQTVFAAVDCTGHGVPGAFMSIVGNNFLSQAVQKNEISTPASILQFLNEGVSATLRQNVQGESVRDGMDMALCTLNETRTQLQFSGAKNPIYIVRAKNVVATEIPGELKEETDLLSVYEVKGDKQPIGNHSGAELVPFTNHIINVNKGDTIYLFTDGFADQFGGPKEKKYNYKQFRRFLLQISHLPLATQKIQLNAEFDKWKSELEQLDDVLVLGVKI